MIHREDEKGREKEARAGLWGRAAGGPGEGEGYSASLYTLRLSVSPWRSGLRS